MTDKDVFSEDEVQGRYDADPLLQSIVQDALEHPERAVPRTRRSRFWEDHERNLEDPEYAQEFAQAQQEIQSCFKSGPGHASFCGNEEVHTIHRHTKGEDDPNGYEVCEGVEPQVAQPPLKISREQLDKATDAVVDCFHESSERLTTYQLASGAAVAAFMAAGFTIEI